MIYIIFYFANKASSFHAIDETVAIVTSV